MAVWQCVSARLCCTLYRSGYGYVQATASILSLYFLVKRHSTADGLWWIKLYHCTEERAFGRSGVMAWHLLPLRGMLNIWNVSTIKRSLYSNGKVRKGKSWQQGCEVILCPLLCNSPHYSVVGRLADSLAALAVSSRPPRESRYEIEITPCYREPGFHR